MKKHLLWPFLLFLGSTMSLLFSVAQGQSIEYEVIRTQEAPGYFAVRLYPGKNLPPLALEDIYIKNFPNSEQKKYSQIISYLKQHQKTILEKEEVGKALRNPYSRIILLGSEIVPGYYSFAPSYSNPQKVLEEFLRFERTYLQNAYLKNISLLNTSENLVEVIPETHPFLTEKSTFFVGKFLKSEKALLLISAETPNAMYTFHIPLDLTHPTSHPQASMLPKLWMAVKQLSSPPTSFWESKVLLYLFPFLLLFIGGTFLWLSFRHKSSKTTLLSFEDIPLEALPFRQKRSTHFKDLE